VLQKRPESYQNKVKHVILPKENQKKVNYFEESNNKLPTPIRPTEPLEVIRRDCGELCNTSRVHAVIHPLKHSFRVFHNYLLIYPALLRLSTAQPFLLTKPLIM
jgi:hypothetical protein